MLVLTRNVDEVIHINDEISIKIIRINGKQAKVGIEAPKHIRICREEIYSNSSIQNSK